MFAIFSKETALPPSGLLALKQTFETDGPEVLDSKDKTRESSELKRQCSETLDKIHSSHSESRAVDLGDGNGFNFRASPYCHYAADNSVSCLFCGEVAEWPGLDLMAENHNAYVTGFPEDAHDEASWLLTFYTTFHSLAYKGIANEALQSLAKIEGGFAFVIYDSKHHRVLAARDRNGSQAMFWGSTTDGRMMFASDVLDLTDCEPSATAFPAGSLFMSESKAKAMQPGEFGWTIDNHVVPGDLRSFVPRTVPALLSEFRGVKVVQYESKSPPPLVLLPSLREVWAREALLHMRGPARHRARLPRTAAPLQPPAAAQPRALAKLFRG